MKKNSKIYNTFRKGSTLSLSRFIFLCLYEKNYGYYQKNRIGTDFITAPETSQLFGECVSIFIASIIERIGNIRDFCELGPGNGTLTKDLSKNLNTLIKKELNFFLFEKSNSLIKNIKKNINCVKISFLKKLIFPPRPIFFIANEFFDALPINQFEKTSNGWLERRVSLIKGKLMLTLKKNPFFKFLERQSKKGDIDEVSPYTKLYLKRIFSHLNEFGGGLLIFDYGPLKKKKIDTLQSIYKKKKSYFLNNPYEADITYHVDFEKIRQQAIKSGLFFYGPITQKKFLFFNGVNERFIKLSRSLETKKQFEILNSQFTRLTDAKGMGNLIKCTFITKKELKLNFF